MLKPNPGRYVATLTPKEKMPTNDRSKTPSSKNKQESAKFLLELLTFYLLFSTRKHLYQFRFPFYKIIFPETRFVRVSQSQLPYIHLNPCSALHSATLECGLHCIPHLLTYINPFPPLSTFSLIFLQVNFIFFVVSIDSI